jgi:hypothetical protein
MNAKRLGLLKGALKSAVGSATGMVLSLNIVDAKDFSLATVGGLKHLGFVIAVSVVVAEAHYFNQWANSKEEADGTAGVP